MKRFSNTAKVLGAMILIIGLTAGSWFMLNVKDSAPLPPGLEDIILPDPKPIEPFLLRDHNGKDVNVDRFLGQWSLVFFGYTHCPDICPTTLTVMKGTRKEFQREPSVVEGTQFIFVSVDPKRDTPEHLKTYVTYFDPTFLGVTGDREQIDNLAGQMGAVYIFDGDTNGDDYIVNHSATILLVDPQGRLYAKFSPPHSAKSIGETFRRVREFYDQ